jgi:hypothetical protein
VRAVGALLVEMRERIECAAFRDAATRQRVLRGTFDGDDAATHAATLGEIFDGHSHTQQGFHDVRHGDGAIDGRVAGRFVSALPRTPSAGARAWRAAPPHRFASSPESCP